MPHDFGTTDFRTPAQRVEDGARAVIRDLMRIGPTLPDNFTPADEDALFDALERKHMPPSEPTTPVLRLAEKCYPIEEEGLDEHIKHAVQLLRALPILTADLKPIEARLFKALALTKGR